MSNNNSGKVDYLDELIEQGGFYIDEVVLPDGVMVKKAHYTPTKIIRDKLEAYIANKVNEARIDELKELPAYKYGSWQAMTNEWIDARIKELQSKKIKE